MGINDLSMDYPWASNEPATAINAIQWLGTVALLSGWQDGLHRNSSPPLIIVASLDGLSVVLSLFLLCHLLIPPRIARVAIRDPGSELILIRSTYKVARISVIDLIVIWPILKVGRISEVIQIGPILKVGRISEVIQIGPIFKIGPIFEVIQRLEIRD